MINFSKTTTWLTILLIVFFLAAGIFAFQWWQVKGELAKQIEQNQNLIQQVNELQKEIEELKVSEEKITDEITGWKAYRNEEYGYEVKYPKDWYLHFQQGHLLFTKEETLPDIGDTEPWTYGEQIRIWVGGMINPFTKTPFTSREEWISWYSESYGEWAKREWLSINNIKVLKVISSAAGTSYGLLEYFIFKEDKVYSLGLYPYATDDPILSKNIGILSQMLSTFKFIGE